MTPNWGEDLKTRAIGERNIRRQFYCCCNHSLKKVWYLSIINIFQVDRMGGRPMHVSEADALAFFLRSFSSNQATNKFQSSNHWGAGNRTSGVPRMPRSSEVCCGTSTYGQGEHFNSCTFWIRTFKEYSTQTDLLLLSKRLYLPPPSVFSWNNQSPLDMSAVLTELSPTPSKQRFD